MSATLKGTTPEDVLQNPPEIWCDSESQIPDPEADRLSWALAIRCGLADRASMLAGQVKPQVDRLRLLLRQAVARDEPLLIADYTRRLRDLEPGLIRNEAIGKATAPWLGRGGKFLDRRVADAEAAVAVAGLPLARLDAGVSGLRELAAEAHVAFEPVLAAVQVIEGSLRKRLGATQKALEALREERDANNRAIARLEAELSKRHAATKKAM